MPDTKDSSKDLDNTAPDDKLPNGKKARKLMLPSQIPLLEDVILDLTNNPEHTIITKQKKRKATQNIHPLDKPLATDLFGDPIHSYAVNVENKENAQGIDQDVLHSQATQVVDSLVKEYSQEIVRRLHSELTSVLNDLTEEKASAQALTGKPPSINSKQVTPKEKDPEQDQ